MRQRPIVPPTAAPQSPPGAQQIGLMPLVAIVVGVLVVAGVLMLLGGAGRTAATLPPTPDPTIGILTPTPAEPTAAPAIPSGFAELPQAVSDGSFDGALPGAVSLESGRAYRYQGEQRGLIGRASAEDVRDLLEEGVDVAPLPILPDDTN